jgi:hypothetical protein
MPWRTPPPGRPWGLVESRISTVGAARCRAYSPSRRRSSPGTRSLRRALVTWDSAAKTRGQGKFDAQVFLDGTAFRPDGRSAATLIPPAFGLAGINMHTSTGWVQKGGFYHDGRFAKLDDVVKHYDEKMSLSLTADQRHDLVEFLKSL